MKPIIYLLCLYIGFVAGSLQILAFQNKLEVLGILLLVTILAIFMLGMKTSMKMKQAKKKPKAIPRRASVARSSKASKSKEKVVAGRR